MYAYYETDASSYEMAPSAELGVVVFGVDVGYSAAYLDAGAIARD